MSYYHLLGCMLCLDNKHLLPFQNCFLFNRVQQLCVEAYSSDEKSSLEL